MWCVYSLIQTANRRYVCCVLYAEMHIHMNERERERWSVYGKVRNANENETKKITITHAK